MEISFFFEFGDLPVVTAAAESQIALIQECGARSLNIGRSIEGDKYIAHMTISELLSKVDSPSVTKINQALTPKFERWFWVKSSMHPISVTFGYSSTEEVRLLWQNRNRGSLISMWPILDQEIGSLLIPEPPKPKQLEKI